MTISPVRTKTPASTMSITEAADTLGIGRTLAYGARRAQMCRTWRHRHKPFGVSPNRVAPICPTHRSIPSDLTPCRHESREPVRFAR
jgi:hypothetical protein